MASINFSLSAKVDGRGYAQILLRVSAGRGATPRAKSGVFIPTMAWNAKKSRIVASRFNEEAQRELHDAQRVLDDLSAYILDRANTEDPDVQLTSEWLAGVVKEFHHPKPKTSGSDIVEAFERFMAEKNYSRYRAFSFRRTFRSLQRWAIIRDRELTFEVLNERTLADFDTFLRDEHRYANDQTFAELYKEERGAKEERGRNTINGMLTQLRTFVRWAVEQGATERNPFVRYKVKESIYGTPYFISVEERRQLYAATMPTEALAAIRDIFIFQCCVGCRVGDLSKMTTDNVIRGALEYVPRKTKEGNPVVVRVVLNATALEIVERYKGQADGRLLPFVADQYYNRGIKQCFEVAGLTRLVTTIDPKTRAEVKRPLHEVASSHLARRTFVGNLYKQIKDPNIIASMSGHKEGSRAFARYRTIDDDIKAEAVALLD